MRDQMDLKLVEAELAKMMAETSKLNAETAKLTDERIKLSKEHTWMPFVWGVTVATALIGATAAVVKLLHYANKLPTKRLRKGPFFIAS